MRIQFTDYQKQKMKEHKTFCIDRNNITMECGICGLRWSPTMGLGGKLPNKFYVCPNNHKPNVIIHSDYKVQPIGKASMLFWKTVEGGFSIFKVIMGIGVLVITYYLLRLWWIVMTVLFI